LGSKLIPDGDALKRKVDGQRETFLKGVSTTKHGKKEDPTYLHFRFIFDFGETSIMDPETFLAPSPLFRPTDRTANQDEIISFARANGVAEQDIPNYIRALTENEAKSGNGNFYSGTDFFYGSKFEVKSRAQQGAFNINGGGVGYMGAQRFLAQRSVKRQQMLEAFKKGLRFINEKCPYYFQSISGLEQLLKVDIKNLHKPAGKPQRMGTLAIDCLESIDMRIFSLSELYRKAIYDYTYHRVMLPENLRKFRMWLVVSEIRNIQMSYGINDILNPFSIPSVAQAANFVDSFNSQTGFLDNTGGLLQKSTNALGITQEEPQDKFGSYTLGPYAFIYQFDQCEFDFDDSYPSFSLIDNKGGSAVTNKFKIHVGRVKDYKIQFNALSDIIKKEDNIKSMVLSDVWGSKTSGYTNYDYTGTEGLNPVTFDDKANPAEYFASLASNFITNSVADLKDQGVQLLQGALLGNIYGLGGINVGAATRNVQSLVNTLKEGIPNPFADNTPQAQGLGGPDQRQYPTIKEDVYLGVPNPNQQNLGTAYNSQTGTPGTASGDVYSNNPGSDLGLPDRQYPVPGGDEYKNVPGSDSGVPGRVYPTIEQDIYTTNPGADAGLPDRQYPTSQSDEYNDVPGSSLGVPGRIYPEPNDDAYENNPGSDLGLPERQYPQANDDVYSDPSVVDTSNIGSVYPDTNNTYGNLSDKEYDEPQNIIPGNIGDVYPETVNSYGNLNDKEYTEPGSSSTENIGDVYENTENNYPGLNEKVYVNPAPREENLGEVYKDTKNEYPSVNDISYDLPSNVNNILNEDVYKSVPGSDLGTPGRNYKSINESLYRRSNGPINISNIGRVYPTTGNENN
jgi:hypothetical protein